MEGGRWKRSGGERQMEGESDEGRQMEVESDGGRQMEG